MATENAEKVLAFATGKNIRISPTKARPVINLIRGKNVNAALAFLENERRRANPIIQNILKSAIANAVEFKDATPDDLYISMATVDGGRTLKRMRPRAMGRGALIRKRSCHIYIGVGLQT